MKLRDPMTFAGAVHNVVLTIGYEHSANVVGRSVSLVTKWADPDNPSLPGFEQGVLLDAAFQETTCKPGPIIQAYTRQLDILSDPLLGDPRIDVCGQLLDTIEDLFTTLADVRRHTKTRGAFGTAVVPVPPTEEEMEDWTHADRIMFDAEVAEIEDRCATAGFFTKDTLDRLEIRGLITAGKYWGQYSLTPAGKALKVKEPA